MPRATHTIISILGVVLLSASLVSCSSNTGQNASSLHSDPPAVSTPQQTQPVEVTYNNDEPNSEHLSTPTPASPPPADEQPPSPSSPIVEVSTIEPPPTKANVPPDVAFQPESPSLGGIELGASDEYIFKQCGLPIDKYPLPGDKQSIEIWEYNGFSLGLSDTNKVIYVEITSSAARTGIEGLHNGMSGTQAAQLLGVQIDDQTNVLTVGVTGGWIKLDLDPETQKVLSLRLLSSEI